LSWRINDIDLPTYVLMTLDSYLSRDHAVFGQDRWQVVRIQEQREIHTDIISQLPSCIYSCFETIRLRFDLLLCMTVNVSQPSMGRHFSIQNFTKNVFSLNIRQNFSLHHSTGGREDIMLNVSTVVIMQKINFLLKATNTLYCYTWWNKPEINIK